MEKMEDVTETNFNFGINFKEALKDENASSQELAEEDLDEMVEGSKPESTKRCTTWGLKKFLKWSEKRNKPHVDLKTVSLEELKIF